MVPVKVNANVYLDNTGVVHKLPAIVTEGGILKSHLQYLVNHRKSRSPSWIDRSAFAVGLLLEFWEANQDVTSDPQTMFREFALSLYTGTVGDDGEDPSNLRWLPRKEADAKQIINHITHYCDWLSRINEEDGFQINPRVKPDSLGERMNLAAHYHRKRNAFLGHLFTTPLNSRRALQLPRSSTIHRQEVVKFFPEGRMGDLLSEGFVKRGGAGSPDITDRLNLRDILITMLMFYGGLRISECFHIWIDDITIVEGQCIVKVYHPSQGLAPDGRSNRAAFLRERFGLRPRNEYPKGHILHSGWKDPALVSPSGKFFVVNWFPLEAGEHFKRLWSLYLRTQYVRPHLGDNHRYAFTTLSGSPYSIKGYTASRKRAVERIGLTFSKEAGTTPHGDRHSYGQRLAKGGLREEIIMKAMHHKSPESQAVYTEPTDQEVRNEFRKAEGKMEQKTLSDLERLS